MNEMATDEELVRKARAGDREAFSALVRKYQMQAVLIAQGVLKNFELARDVSQDAFAKAYFRLGQFREESKFKTWFFRIVMNEAKDTYRKEKSRGLFRIGSVKTDDEGGSDSLLEFVPSRFPSPREEAEVLEKKQQLDQAMGRLPEKEREVFILRFLNGLSLIEISETLGVALGTVKAHLSHGTEKMKSLLLCFEEKAVPSSQWEGGDSRG